MRRHALLARYAPFIEPGRFARVVGAPFLVAARLQPSFYPWGEGWIDLVFSRAGEIALVPFVQIDPAMVYVREASPFLWPVWLPVEETAVAEIEALLEPWLLSHTLLRGLDEEVIGFFTDDAAARALFDEGRAARFLCASDAETVFTDAAPYVYAQRFAAGKRVSIKANDASFGASILARIANTVHADLGDEARNELARRWYGVGLFGDVPKGTFDVEIAPATPNGATASVALDVPLDDGLDVALARPVFPLLACSFDPADAAPVRHFSVRAREPIVRRNRLRSAAIIGGSAGRIAVVVRDDGLRVPDADIDQARALVAALSAQGFDAVLTVASAARAEHADLIHLFGHRHVHQFEFVLERAAATGVPVVVTPLLDDFANEALWGTGAIRTMLAGIRDQAGQHMIERGLVSRLLLTDDKAVRGKAAYDEAAVRSMLEQCGAAIFSTAAEEREARARFGFVRASRVVPGVPSASVDPEPIGALAGLDEFVLVHAAVEARANQWLAIAAAAAAGTPLVLVGSVEDSEHYQALLEAAGDGVVWLPEDALSPGQLEALYGAARVYADLSWAGHGAARIVRAAGHGAVPVLSTALGLGELWPDLTGGIDPASAESAATVLRQAWMRAPAVSHQIAEQTAQRYDPLESLKAVLGAYAEAAGLKSGVS